MKKCKVLTFLIILVIILTACGNDSFVNKTYCVNDDSLCLCKFFNNSGDEKITINKLQNPYKDFAAKKERSVYIKPLDKTIVCQYESSFKEDQTIIDEYKSDKNESIALTRDGELTSIMFFEVYSKSVKESEFVPLDEETLIRKANEFFDEYVENKGVFLKPELKLVKEGIMPDDLVKYKYVVEYGTKYKDLNTDTRVEVIFNSKGDFKEFCFLNNDLYFKCVQNSIEIDKEKIQNDIAQKIEDCKEKMNASGYMTFNEANITNQTIGLCYIGKKEFISVNSEVVISYTIHHDEAAIEKGKYLYPDEEAEESVWFATILAER